MHTNTIPHAERAAKAAHSIQPSDISAYIDCVHAWLPRRLSARELAWLAQHCGELHVPKWRKRWDRVGYQQYVDLKQPTDAALHYLHSIGNVLVNYVEFALDWTFNYEDERDAAWSFTDRHIVKRWHRHSQGIRYVKGTRYTAGRHGNSNLVSYADKPSRITGEVHCLHIEYRMRLRALQRIGISSAKDLLNYDHHAFWTQRLIMRAIDLDRFGRRYNRQILHEGPRYGAWTQSITDRSTYNYDRRTGYTIARLHSTQAVIDQYRRYLDVNRCLVDLDIGHLMPKSPVDTAAMAKNNIATGQWFTGGRNGMSPLIIATPIPPAPLANQTLTRAKHQTGPTPTPAARSAQQRISPVTDGEYVQGARQRRES